MDNKHCVVIAMFLCNMQANRQEVAFAFSLFWGEVAFAFSLCFGCAATLKNGVRVLVCFLVRFLVRVFNGVRLKTKVGS